MFPAAAFARAAPRNRDSFLPGSGNGGGGEVDGHLGSTRRLSGRPKRADFGTTWQRPFIRARARTQPAMGEATQKKSSSCLWKPCPNLHTICFGPEPRRAPLVKVPEASAFGELHHLAENYCEPIALAPTTNLTRKPLPLAAQWGCALRRTAPRVEWPLWTPRGLAAAKPSGSTPGGNRDAGVEGFRGSALSPPREPVVTHTLAREPQDGPRKHRPGTTRCSQEQQHPNCEPPRKRVGECLLVGNRAPGPRPKSSAAQSPPPLQAELGSSAGKVDWAPGKRRPSCRWRPLSDFADPAPDLCPTPCNSLTSVYG